MNVLVTAASKHGATTQIAEVIAESLRGAGLAVHLRSLDEEPDPAQYDAVVLGSAIYAGRWLEPARTFVERHGAILAERPVWLFSSGPIGDPPLPEGDPPETVAMADRLSARGHRTFAGRLDRSGLGPLERAITRALKAPDGDFRDWEEVRAWATEIGLALEDAATVA
jgi:menaquinone-dependent protoporphyrinogen oxidase